MNLERHVPDREYCDILREWGFPQETEHYWYIWKDKTGTIHADLADKGFKDFYNKTRQEEEITDVDFIAAPLVTEILEQLPSEITKGETVYGLEIRAIGGNEYEVSYMNYTGDTIIIEDGQDEKPKH
jgi:hypothetical protein